MRLRRASSVLPSLSDSSFGYAPRFTSPLLLGDQFPAKWATDIIHTTAIFMLSTIPAPLFPLFH